MTTTTTRVVFYGPSRGVRHAVRPVLADMFGVPRSHVEFRECARGEEDTEIARTPGPPSVIRISWERLSTEQQDELRDAIDRAR